MHKQHSISNTRVEDHSFFMKMYRGATICPDFRGGVFLLQGYITPLIFLGVLLLLSAFFSAAETALISLDRFQVRHLVEEGRPQGLIIQRLIHKPNNLIATILIGSNIVNIGASALATSLAIALFGAKGVGIATAAMTFLILVFGEITPKTFAAQNAVGVSTRVARIIELFSIVLAPLIGVLGAITNGLIRLLGGKVSQRGPFVTEDEIRMLVNAGQEEGLFEEEEREMIDSILEFDDTVAREIMVPRIDMTAADVEDGFDKILNLIIDDGHIRIPIYEHTVDNVIGIIHGKDLLRVIKDGVPGSFDVRKLLRPAYYVPDSRKVRDLLADMRKEQVHMAIVLDEYGGTAGLVTVEDMVEEIIGDIRDEFDREENLVEILGADTVRVDARTAIDDVNDMLDLNLPDEDFDTVGGLVFNLIGRVPREGEEILFDDVQIRVENIAGRRISKVKISKVSAG